MRRFTLARAVAGLACLATLGGCKVVRLSDAAVVDRETLTDADWNAVAQRRVFFGHQSVGDNIVQGIAELEAQHPSHTLRVLTTERPDTVQGPALMHHLVGHNYDPASKTAEFGHVIGEAKGEPGLIALHKFCFVDATDSTNPERLFAEYRLDMDSLAEQYPRVTFVHVTMPLFSVAPAGPVTRTAKRLLGRGESRELGRSVTRNRYNTKMRATYATSGRLFDLAGVESTRPDGSRSFFVANGDTVYTLASEYTTDGGHLNTLGRRRAAVAFLAFLARM
jgi:hypothetical protein